MKAEERLKLNNKLDKILSELNKLYIREKALRIMIHNIHAKLNEDAKRK